MDTLGKRVRPWHLALRATARYDKHADIDNSELLLQCTLLVLQFLLLPPHAFLAVAGGRLSPLGSSMCRSPFPDAPLRPPQHKDCPVCRANLHSRRSLRPVSKTGSHRCNPKPSVLSRLLPSHSPLILG